MYNKAFIECDLVINWVLDVGLHEKTLNKYIYFLT